MTFWEWVIYIYRLWQGHCFGCFRFQYSNLGQCFCFVRLSCLVQLSTRARVCVCVLVCTIKMPFFSPLLMCSFGAHAELLSSHHFCDFVPAGQNVCRAGPVVLCVQGGAETEASKCTDNSLTWSEANLTISLFLLFSFSLVCFLIDCILLNFVNIAETSLLSSSSFFFFFF